MRRDGDASGRGAAALALIVAVSAACASGEKPRPSPPSPAGGVRHGIALPAWDRDAYGGARARDYVTAIAATGARWVQLTPTWYQTSANADTMRPTGETASDSGLRGIIGLAHAAGLKVLLKPHVDLPGDRDRSTIRPRDPAGWFASYTGFITHYAELARRTGVAEFAVGTELAGVSGDRARWTAVIGAVRARFGGPIVYAANYDEYRRVPFWDALDLIGVNAYWPLAGRPTADPTALRRAWRPIERRLAGFAARHRRPIVFTEAGYVSQRGTTTAPYAWEISTTSGEREQAAAYEALLATFTGRAWWAGVHWWMWDDWPGSADTPRALAYTPHGKPAEQTLRRWWRPR